MRQKSLHEKAEVRTCRLPASVAVLAFAGCLAWLGGGPVQAEQRVKVGVNDYTGEPIWMRVGLPHPVTVDYRGRDRQEKPTAESVERGRKWLATLDPAALAPKEPGKVRGLGRQVWSVVDNGFVMLDAGQKQSEELNKAMACLRGFLGAVTTEDVLQGGSDFADSAARSLYLLAEAGEPADQLHQLAQPLYQGILNRGALRWKRRAGDIWFWNMGPVEVIYWANYTTAEEKRNIKNAIYSAVPSDSGSNNNGRWGWIMDWPVALAFEDAEIMQGVLRAYKHWLAFNLYPSGIAQDWESYDYSCGGKDSALRVLSNYLDGLKPETFRTPGYPVADSTQRFGFEDTRNPRELPRVIWKDIDLFSKRWTNHLPPDGRNIGINDTGPAAMTPAHFQVHNFNVASLDLASSAILRGGPACDAALWGEKTRTADPELVMQTFWAYLHADPSDAIHNHYDTNQLLLWWNGVHLAGTSGCDCSYESGIYNRKNGLYAMYTYSKNTVTVDQRPQYISHGKVLDYVATPGFRTATTDAGYVYDGVFHQRTIAMLPEYLVDMNLLPARNPDDKTSHTFDYMMNGVGEFDRISGWDDFDANRLTFDGHCRSEQEYLRWPNLLHIYPYVTWGRTRSPKADWDVSWGEDGRHLRMMVAGMPDENRKACLGRAQIAHRGYDDKAFPRGHERLMFGVPKVLLRREGPSASFLVLYEPHSGRSAIKTWKRLDQRACEVGLASGHTDLVLLRRKQVGHLWVRYYRNTWCYDPPHVQTQADLLRKVFVSRAQVLQLGELTLFESDKPLPALLLDSGDPSQRMLLLYVRADQVTTLQLALPQEPLVVDAFTGKVRHSFADGKLAIELPQGVSRLSLTFPRAFFLTTKAGSINPAKLCQDLGLEEVKEATDDWNLNRSKLALNLEYKRPRVYADGAYDGMKGVAPWTAAISENGEFAVVGTHEGYVEALSPAGRLWRRYIQGKCLVDYNYASPGRNIIGRGHLGNPLAMKADGSRTFVGTDAGMLYCLDRDGHVLWEQKTEFRVQSLSISSDAAFVAVAADNRLFLFDASGKPLLDRTLEQAIIDVLLTRDGRLLFYSAGDGTIECLDTAGKPQWKYQPALVDTGGATMYRHGMVFDDLAVDAAANTLVGCHADYGIYAFDARTGNLRWRWGAESSQYNIAISDDGKHIASSADGELFYLDATGKLLWKFVGAFFGYNCLRMSRDGQYVAIVNPTGEWFLLSRDKRILTRTPVLTPEPMALGMTPDARRVVLAGIGYDVMMFDNVLD